MCGASAHKRWLCANPSTIFDATATTIGRYGAISREKQRPDYFFSDDLREKNRSLSTLFSFYADHDDKNGDKALFKTG